MSNHDDYDTDVFEDLAKGAAIAGCCVALAIVLIICALFIPGCKS